MQTHIPEEWRIRDVEQKADRANSRLYEIDSLRSDVARLEHSARETGSDIAQLRAQISTLQDSVIEQLRRQIEELTAQPKGKP